MSYVQDTEKNQYEVVDEEDNDDMSEEEENEGDYDEMSDEEEDEEDYNESSEEEKDDRKIGEDEKQEFNKKECVYFVPGKMLRCGCGLLKKEHKKELQEKCPTPIFWSVECHTKEFKTDANGEILFENTESAKYIRVSSSTKAENLEKFMNLSWEIKKKDLKFLLSIIGNGKEPSFQPKLATFCKGLIDAFGALGTWIITEGTHAGVMKHIGEAVNKYNIDNIDEIVSIGIATWGNISNWKALVNNNSLEFIDYDVPMDELETSLDMNHSYFILVDSGMYNSNKIDQPTYDLRNRLEKQIIQDSQENGNRISSVVILVEGTPDTLTSVMASIQNEVPVIIIGRSGKVANLLEFAYNNSEPLVVEVQVSEKEKMKKVFSFHNDKFENKLLEKIEEIYPEYKDKTDLKDKVINCIYLRDFITIFYIDNETDFFMVVFKALIKAKKINQYAQMRLLMDSNRADIAKNYFLPSNFHLAEIKNLMFKAIIKNKTSFVNIFYLYDCNLSYFLIPIMKANNKIGNETAPKKGLLYKLFGNDIFKQIYDVEDIKDISHIKDIILKQTGNYFEHNWNPDGKLSDLVYFLFIWCVLMRRKEMALFFWQLCKHPISSALAAQFTTRTMYDRRLNEYNSLKLKEDECAYGKVAVDMFTKFYAFKPHCDMILNQNLPEFNNRTIFHMAVKANNKEFVGHAAYQDSLSNKWNGKLYKNNSNIQIFFSLIIPFLAPFIITHYKISHKQTKATNRMKLKCEEKSDDFTFESSYFQKIHYFCSIPLATFFYNCVSHFALLILFAIILQNDFYPIDGKEHPVISNKEIILIIWMMTILMEEIRQMISNETKEWLMKLKIYCTNNWNILDMLSLALFICGMILRFQPTSSCRRCFYSARIVLTFSLLGLCLRVLHMFSVDKVLGPKLIMMRRMIIDLFHFMLILMVVITSYGVSSQLIMYPNQEIDIVLFKNIYTTAWWDIFGSLSIDEISGYSCNSIFSNVSAEECAATYRDTDDWTKCPSREDQCPANSWVVLIMLAVYVLIVNIMMLNMLIAIFNFTFEKIQNESELIWTMQHYFLVCEYELRPSLPPPFIFFSHISLIYDYFFNRSEKCSMQKDNKNNYSSTYNYSPESLLAREFYETNLKLTDIQAQECMSQLDKLKIKTKKDKLKKIDKMEKQLDLLIKNLDIEETIKKEKKTLKLLKEKAEKDIKSAYAKKFTSPDDINV